MRRFRVHWGGLSRKEKAEWQQLGCPETVPWELLAPHESRAQMNHGQTLELLHERGGLSPAEMMCVLENRSLRTLEPDVVEIPRLQLRIMEGR